jgi:Ca2+-binding RTX toxin-like protein
MAGEDDNDDMSGGAGDDTMKGEPGDDELYGIDYVVNNDSLDAGTGTNDACGTDPDPEVNCDS